MSDDVTREPEQPPASPDVVSLAAQHVKRRRADFARAGAAAELADLAALETVLAEADALASEPVPAPEPDGSDITRRLERVARKGDLTGRLGDIMARVCAGSPEEAALWRVIAGGGREGAAHARQAADIAARTGIA